MVKTDQQRPKEDNKGEHLNVHFGRIRRWRNRFGGQIRGGGRFREFVAYSLFVGSSLEPLEEVDTQKPVKLKADHDEQPAD